MRHAWAVLLLFLMPWYAQAAVVVDAGRQFPVDGNIAERQGFYLELEYQSDEDTYLWIRPWFRGQPIATGSNPSFSHPAGTGRALGWFFLHRDHPRADTVQVLAGDGSGFREVARFPVDVSLSPGATPRPEPAWMTALLAEQAAVPYENIRQPPNPEAEKMTPSDWILPIIFLSVIGSAVIAPLILAWFWRGVWRWLALLPALVMVGLFVKFLVDTARDPTSHNLWPFEFLIYTFAVWVVIVVLAGLRYGLPLARDWLSGR